MGHPVTDGGTFGMMAGENPMHPAKVEATHENLKAHLKSLGLQFHETEGKYGTPERSVIIYKPRRDQMTTLGKMFGQDSVIWSQGGKHELVYTNGAQEGQSLTTHPNQPPHEWFADQPEDYYTKIPGHGYFRINFNFGEPTAKAEKPVPVKHFSVKDNLTELDPKFQGTGMVGAEKNRPNRLPRTYFYHRNAAPEGVVTAGAAHEYHGELPTGTKLYNMGQDELGLNTPSWKQTKQGQIYHTPDLDTVERTLARKGYHGYENYGVDGALAYFHKLPVNRVQASRSPILKRSKLKKAAWARSPLNRLRKAWPQHLSPEDVGGKGILNNPDTQTFMAPHQDAAMEGRGDVLPVQSIPKPAGAVVSGNKRAVRAESQYKDFRPDEPGGPSTRWAMTGPASLRTRAANRANGRDLGISTPANQNIIEGRSGQNVTSDIDPSGGWATNSWNTPQNDGMYWNEVGTDSHNQAFPIPSTEFNGNPVHFKWSKYQDGTYIDAYIDNRGGGTRYGTSLALWKLNPETGAADLSHTYDGSIRRSPPDTGSARNELDRIHSHLNSHLATLQGMHKNAIKMAKALPAGAKLNVDGPIGDQTANNANRQGFPGSAQHMVMEDAGGGPQNRGTNPVAPTHGSVTGLLHQIGNTGEKPGHNLVRYSGAKDANRVADAERGWSTNTDEMFFDNPEEPARASVRPNGASYNLAPGFANQLNENDEFDRRNERRFWSHPNFYEWHDTHTSHHNPRPWDKQQAIEDARGLGLIKNDQAAGVGTPRYAEFASPYGTVNPGQKSNLLHYDYHNKLQDVAGVVARHGFKTYYAGGQHGKPDLAHRNYDTGHLMIYDPTPQSGGDFGERNYTDAWRQMHELSHALTHHDVNKVYGEARRIGALGQHRTLHEAQRSVHWEWLAAHKQRELNKQIGIHVPDETFHKELNTIMHDAVHRAVTGKFTEPSQEGFTPHSHKVPLEVALDTVRKEGTRLGLAGHHELIRKHEPRPMVKFVKALPKK